MQHVDQMLTTRDVVSITRRHRSTICRWMQAGLFPAPREYKGHLIGWMRSDVEHWQNQQRASVSLERACSIKWKVTPQNQWANQWPPAQPIWRADGKVIRLIGYDCSPRDQRRYAGREGYTDQRYVYRYPPRDWGLDVG